jgi:DNA-binding NtrC family response regulator
VKGHGGRISFESRVGHGTTFTVNLPINPPKGKAYTDRIPRREPWTRSMPAGLLEPPKGPVVVIDDEWWVRDFLQEALAEAGLEVLVAEDGEKGLRLVAERDPGAVFLDVLLPGMPGADVAKRILAEKPRTRLVLMSGRLESLDAIEKLLESGVHAFLRKPFEMQDVYNVLGIALTDAADEREEGEEKAREGGGEGREAP